MRRVALSFVLIAATAVVLAQPASRVPRVGYLGFQGEPRDASPLRDAFLLGMRDVGYTPGQNIVIDVRRYATNEEMRRALGELIEQRPDVIFVGPPLAAMTAKQMSKDIAIVCGSCGDPVDNGLAASLARPGGNVTGLASLSAELIGKRIGLLKELFPGMRRVAVFVFPANPGTKATLSALDSAARTLGVEILHLEIQGPADFDAAFRSAAAGGASAVVLQDDPLTRIARNQIVELGMKHRLPISSGIQEIAVAGGLISYGPDRLQMTRRAAVFVDRIIKGAKAANLPFEQAGKFDLIVNLRTARALGLAIPPAFLVRADRVIE